MSPSLPPLPDENDLAEILDLFEEHVYAGAITSDGRYVSHRSGPKLDRFIGGPVPAGRWEGFWESRVHPDDRADYERFNQRLRLGEDAEITYRLIGLDGVTRLLWDRARPRRVPDGGVRVAGIISDVTSRNEAVARLAEVSERFARLLDMVGEHVYVVLAFPDGRFEELFQGPGADRLLGGGVPDSEMENWEAAVHPEDADVYRAYNDSLAAGEDADAEYRLIGADGITRWVHDRARCRRLPDGSVEASGIVSDVTERRRMRAELAQAHAALSQAVDAMDAHLYTLRVDDDGAHVAVYRGPNRGSLAGGLLPDGLEGDRCFETLVHPEDRRRRVAALPLLAAARPIDLEYRVVGLDGRERIVADRLRARRDPDGTLYYDGVMRDITERRRLEDELLRTLEEMQDAHRELERARAEAELRARTDELTGVYNRRHFTEIVDVALRDDPHGTGLLLLDADHFKHVNDHFGHLVGDAVLVELAARLRSFLESGEVLARWGGEEFALLLRGVGSDDEIAERAERLRARVAGAPVMAAGISLGLTISIGAIRAGGELTDVDALVDAADRGLYSAKRGGRNRISLASHVEDAHTAEEPEAVSMARALAAAAGAREGAANEHAGEVSRLATATAESLGLAADVVLRCRLGGWLHDVGKVAIPPRILEKPGPLDADEWQIMRTHPQIGEEILLGVAALREAAAAVRHHHERYGGDGYPDGLAGPAIPIEARIVAAADAFSAMTVNRVYSQARSAADAAIELRRSAGAHLDPVVVEALLTVLGLAAAEDARVA
ncbi:MAG TPA: diguanylate cyclase [Gaiellales bacterium]|jgi:diguanylate cyclase (GGDEF)-like protein/PAS domain S-box-containing protein